MKIVLTGSAGCYRVKGHEHIMVMNHKGRTWSGRLGSHAFSEWYAVDTSKRREDAPDHDCFYDRKTGALTKPFLHVGKQHHSLAALRKELARLLA